MVDVLIRQFSCLKSSALSTSAAWNCGFPRYGKTVERKPLAASIGADGSEFNEILFVAPLSEYSILNSPFPKCEGSKFTYRVRPRGKNLKSSFVLLVAQIVVASDLSFAVGEGSYCVVVIILTNSGS